MSFKKEKILTSKKFIKILYWFIKGYQSTFRLEVKNEEKWIDILNSGGKVILCSWHQQFFSCLKYFKNYSHLNPSLMISQSRDGEMIAGVAKITGWHPARGSSSRGGRHAMEEMIDRINKTGMGAHILDGPTGPPGIVKNGIIKMAVETGAAIVPIYPSSENEWHASSWDKFIIPKPFSKVKIEYGDPIFLKKTDDIDQLENYRKDLEDRMKFSLKYFDI